MTQTRSKEKVKALLKSAWKAGEALLRNKTKLELSVLGATSEVPWGPTGAAMAGKFCGVPKAYGSQGSVGLAGQ